MAANIGLTRYINIKIKNITTVTKKGISFVFMITTSF